MSEVVGSPEQLDSYGWAVWGRAVDTDCQPYDTALSAFLANPDNDLGTGGLTSLVPEVEAELGEVARIGAAAQAFGQALAAVDRDAALGTVTLEVPAGPWSTLRRELNGLSATDLLDRADDLTAQRRRDERAADTALESIRRSLFDGGFDGVRQDDLEAIRRQFEDLSPAALDIAVAGMTDAELARLFDQMNEGWFKGGLDDGERERFHLTIGMRANSQTWRRYASFTDELDPPVEGDLADTARLTPAALGAQTPYAPVSQPLEVGGFHARDVNQGLIGDCYLIAAMQNLALHEPAALEGIVAPTGNGLFVVTFGDGRRQIVGPDFPVGSSGEPTFARPGVGDPTPESWAMLIEKAYAQRNGGWESIVGGLQAEAIEDLTGRDAHRLDPAEVSIDDLATRFDAGERLGIATIDPPPQGKMTDDEYADFKRNWIENEAPEPFRPVRDGVAQDTYERLHPNHAFIVTAVDSNAGTVTVVNPWNPEGGEVVLTTDEIQSSVDFLEANDAP